MPPPKFSDLSKSVTDLFSDDFGFGATKLTLKSKTASGVSFKVDGSSPDKGSVSASLETKLAYNGVNIKEKWNTKNDVVTELSMDNQFTKGTKFTVEGTFNPGAGFRDLKLKADYAKDNVNTSFGVNSAGLLSSSGVFGFGGKYLLGASADFNTAKNTLASHKVGLGLNERDLTVTATITDATVVDASVFHAVNANTLAGLRLSWSKATSDVGFEVATKYVLDSESFVKAKINKALKLGVSYTQTIRKGVSLTLSALVDASALQSDAHQLGVSLTLEQ